MYTLDDVRAALIKHEERYGQACHVLRGIESIVYNALAACIHRNEEYYKQYCEYHQGSIDEAMKIYEWFCNTCEVKEDSSS